MAKYKTPEYDRRATKKYLDKFDNITLRCEKGTRERARACGLSPKELALLLQEAIAKREAETGGTDTEKNL